MKAFIHVPASQSSALEIEVRFVVMRFDGASKQFASMAPVSRDDSFTWGYGNHHAAASLILIPVDPWTAIKAGMVTFEELQLPEGARALVNMIK